MTTRDNYVSDRSQWGQVSGSGLDRTYVTKPGDTPDGVAAFFYGDTAHRQRLIDENPELARLQPGDQIPGGSRIKVSEDVARGDTTTTS